MPGLLGRVEYIEESMESVNAHRLQSNESLFRLQENIEALQISSGNLQAMNLATVLTYQ